MKEVDNDIKCDSEYVFDESQLLFNITEDEYNIVKCRKQSAEKTLLIERLRYIIDYEYGKYCKSDVRKAPIGEDCESYLHEISDNPAVLGAQEAITMLFQSYQKLHLYGIDVKMLDSLKNEYWIDALLNYLSTHKTSTTAYRSLLSIIHRYYYALANLQHYLVLDEELQMQLNVLRPFATLSLRKKSEPARDKELIEYWDLLSLQSFLNDAFARNVIIALYNNQERKRNDLFRLKRLLDCFECTFEVVYPLLYPHHTLSFQSGINGITIKDISPQTIDPWTIYLSDSNGGFKKVKIDAEVIEDIRKCENIDNNIFLNELKSLFIKLYNNYAKAYHSDWHNILRNRLGISGSESWQAFLKYYLTELGKNPTLDPDYCYDYIVYKHIMSKPTHITSNISQINQIIDNQLTDRLIDLLHKNQSDNQSRFYENCFCIRKIFLCINQEADIPKHVLASNDPVWIDSLKFLNPILNGSMSIINTSVMSIDQVKGLLKEIISEQIIYNEMEFVSIPFKKYGLQINAHVLLKIIWLLINMGINRNGIPLFRAISAIKLARTIFSDKDEKAIGNIRKHIDNRVDTKFTEMMRDKAISIIRSYCEDVLDKKP